MTKITLASLAKQLDAELRGNCDIEITGVASLTDASSNQLAFFDTDAQRDNLRVTKAGAVLIKEADVADCPVPCLVVDAPRLAYAKLVQHMTDSLKKPAGIHPSAVVSGSAHVHKTAYIGPYVVIEAGATIGEGTMIESGCYVGRDATIGNNCCLHANVTIMTGVRMGNDVQIFPGAVIGSDGFGFVPDNGKWVKIPQIGSVVIGNNVEIGAGTTIDRGAQGDTVIGDNVILDNQIQIAHNVAIGSGTAVAGCVGISGSAVIGRNCMIGGGTCIGGHLSIVDGVVISGMSMVTRGISEPGVYSSGVPVKPSAQWRRNVARFQNIDAMAKKVIELEKELARLKEGSE